MADLFGAGNYEWKDTKDGHKETPLRYCHDAINITQRLEYQWLYDYRDDK
jgi:hypothetical protein